MAAKINLSKEELNWRGIRFLDKNSRTFYYEDCYYKAILPSAEDLFTNKSFDYFLNTLYDKGFIPQTTLSTLQVEGFVKVYSQYTEHFHVPLSNSSPLLVKQAAKLYLNLNRFLLENNLALIDGHTHNMLIQKFDAPYWCDIGSIIKFSPAQQLVGIDEFIRYYIYPSLLRQKDSALSDMARYSLQNGISHDAAKALGILENIYKAPPQSRADMLTYLEEIVDDIDFSWEKSHWSDYAVKMQEEKPNLTITQGANNRMAMIMRILKTLKPKSVVDLGANAGVFSRMATTLGAQILAIEPDELAVCRGHHFLQTHGEQAAASPIKFSVGDIRTMHQPGDVVMALALTHHLFLTDLYPWKAIADIFSKHTSKHLITEFMPFGLNTKERPSDLPSNYTIEHFVEQLQNHFEKVEIIEYPMPKTNSPRTLILATNKKQN